MFNVLGHPNYIYGRSFSGCVVGGPVSDPLEYAAENAALRLVQGMDMSIADWEALKQHATNQLQELDEVPF